MEKTAQAFARNHPDSPTTVSVTRYGNVMYSRGSVIPLFVRQLEQGRPLTVTEPSMTRYLMSLQESVDLVEHAFLHAHAGRPVRQEGTGQHRRDPRAGRLAACSATASPKCARSACATARRCSRPSSPAKRSSSRPTRASTSGCRSTHAPSTTRSTSSGASAAAPRRATTTRPPPSSSTVEETERAAAHDAGDAAAWPLPRARAMKILLTGAGGLPRLAHPAASARPGRARGLCRHRDRRGASSRALVAQADAVIHLAGVNRGDDDRGARRQRRTRRRRRRGGARTPSRPADRVRVVYANSVQHGNGTPYGDGQAAGAAERLGLLRSHRLPGRRRAAAQRLRRARTPQVQQLRRHLRGCRRPGREPRGIGSPGRAPPRASGCAGTDRRT